MHSPLFLLLLQVALIVALSRLMGLLFARLRQPQVIGEMIAGIMLGPSVLGAALPAVQGWLFPSDSIALLNTLSQFGVVFFLFLIGLELDPKLLTSRGRSAMAVSAASIALPFALGVAVGVWLIDAGVFGAAAKANPLASALFMGAAMSITAFPVLARILAERNMHATDVGTVAIACAAMNDVAAWVILAFVAAVATAAGPGTALRTAGFAAGYVAVMLLLVRPFLGRLRLVYDRQDRLPHGVLAVIFLLVLLSAFAAEAIGIHAMFGAFVAGFIMPKAGTFVRSLTEKLEDFTVVLLLPIFFAYAGLRTKLGLLGADPRMWAYAAVVITAACVGKFGGTALAARAARTPWRE
jgi:Kef-type K+ transport system membrane component KefB